MRSRTLGVGVALTLSAATSLSGCATTDCVGVVGNPALIPSQVTAIRRHTGELQRWGGTLVAANNLADRTELTVIGYPLDRCGMPQLGQEPIGRFIAVAPGYLETADYRSGRVVTATGLIAGLREGLVGEAPYRYPLLSNAKVRLWPEPDAAGAGPRPWVSIGIGGGSGGWRGGGLGGGVGVNF